MKFLSDYVGLLLLFGASCAFGAPPLNDVAAIASVENRSNLPTPLEFAALNEDGDGDDDVDTYDKRGDRYGFGLGRRSYAGSRGRLGAKRLPLYNFGLDDKRNQPYSFGMGKRATDLESRDDLVLVDGIKRNEQPYSFGLGKRGEQEGKPNAYDNDNEYNGGNSNHIYVEGGYAGGYKPSAFLDPKRNRQYSFGLGKRLSDGVNRRGPSNRYGFGLGRR